MKEVIVIVVAVLLNMAFVVVTQAALSIFGYGVAFFIITSVVAFAFKRTTYELPDARKTISI